MDAAAVTVSGFTERVTQYFRRGGRTALVRDGRHPAAKLTRYVRFETTVDNVRYVFECTMAQLRSGHSFDDAQIDLQISGPGFLVDTCQDWSPADRGIGRVVVDLRIVRPVHETFNRVRDLAAQLGDKLDALPTLVRLSQPAGRNTGTTPGPRVQLVHALYGREGTMCGSGTSRPAFITSCRTAVTCPRCKKRFDTLDLMVPEEGSKS